MPVGLPGEVYNEYWSVSENCDASLGVSFLPDGRLFCGHRLPNPANVILVKLQKDSFPGSRPFFILILSQTLSRISVIRFQ